VGVRAVSAKRCGALCFLIMWLGGFASAQVSPGRNPVSTGTGGPDSPAVSVIRTVTGRVVNALTGAPVPRAMVNLNSRAVLTDSLGQFSFPMFADSQGYVGVTKPGYSQNQDLSDGPAQMKAPNLDTPLEIRIYPNAIVNGVVTGSDGLPLARIPMGLRRLLLDTSGAHSVPAGFTITDVHGNYRFVVPAGRYRVSTTYTPRSVELGEGVLPVAFPPTSSDTELDYFSLGSGEQRQIDLRPRTGRAYTVHLKVDSPEGSRGILLSATTQAGLTFNLPYQAVSDDAPVEVNLPAGSYTLQAIREMGDSAAEGFVRLTVSGDGMGTVPMRLAPVALFPVEVAYEPSATSSSSSAQTVSVRSLNLRLQNRDNDGDAETADARLMTRPDGPVEFRVRQGRFHLSGSPGSSWFVRSATCGATDLLSDDLVVASGAAGSPIRLILSNASGSLHGSTGAQTRSGWVYLIAEGPSLTPAFEIALQTDGSFRWSGPPGQYSVVAVDHRVREDFSNPQHLKALLAGSKSVKVGAGVDVAVDLQLKTLAEVAQ
jgi:hypothetical protein